MAAGWGWSPLWSVGWAVDTRRVVLSVDARILIAEQRMAARAGAWRLEQQRLWSIRINLLLLVGVLLCALF